MTFIVGVMQVIFQAYFLGRYPHRFYYLYHSVVLSMLVFGKWVYYKSMGWHYYMTDFCYAANALLLIFLNVYPKSDILFKMCYFFSNGALAVAVGAFRNQMVFHKMDNLSSLALHMFPQLCLWNLRWHTIPYEQTLPEAERMFLDIDTSFDVYKFFVYPLCFYFCWVSVYFTINFVVAARRIRERNYDNMFHYYANQKWSRDFMYRLGPSFAPIIFISAHFIFFFLCHCCSMLVLYSYPFATFCIVLWLTWSIWNGSCFYMDYFSKKYEASLQRLEEVQQQLEQK